MPSLGKVAAPSSSSGRSVGSRARQGSERSTAVRMRRLSTAAPTESVSGSSTQKRLSDSAASRSVARSARPTWKASDSTQLTNSASEARLRELARPSSSMRTSEKVRPKRAALRISLWVMSSK